MELSTLFVKGMISKKNVEQLVGKEIADDMEFIKNKAIDSIRKGSELGKKLKGRLKK